MSKDELLRNYIYPIATFSGTIIGVGLFSLPYIASKVGIWIMLIYFAILGSFIIFIHYIFAEISLETKDFKRMPGFAKIHLGRWGEVTALLSTIVGLILALLAYLIVGGEFLSSLLSPNFGGDNFIYTFIYFLVGCLVIYFGIKAIAKVEFWGVVLFLITLLLMFQKAAPVLNIKNLFPNPNFNYLFLPYGAILFSLWGAALVPEVEEMLGSQKKLIKRIIPISILIPIFVYLFFIFMVLSVTGESTTESALSGLKNSLGDGAVLFGLLFGVVATFTSFIALGLTLKKVLMFDLGIKKMNAFIITCFVPLILFLLGFKSFIPVISFAGGVLLGIDGILILLMYKKIRPRRKPLAYSLTLVLFLGIVYELIYFVK